MATLILMLIFIYFLFSGLFCGIEYSLEEIFDSDKALVAFIFGLACGWIIVPIKIIRGIKKYMKGE